MKFLFFIFSVLLLTACAPSVKQTLEERGFEYNVPHSLLALQKKEETETHSSFGGAFFFLIGTGGGSSNTSEKTYIGFIVLSSRNEAAMVKFKSERVDYEFVENLTRPEVLFYMDEGTEEGGEDKPTGQLIQNYTSRVTIRLTHEQFSQDIEILKYAGVNQ